METTKGSSKSIQRAIARSRRALLAAQRSDGSWDERSDVGPISTAMVYVSLAWLGALSDDDRKKGAAWLRTQQLADGSFVARPFARSGDLGTTAVAWTALALDDAAESHAAAKRAREYVEARGGADAIVDRMKTGDVSAVFCALGGTLDPKKLPDPGLAWCLAMPAVELAATRVHFGIIMGALMLSAIGRRLRGDWGDDEAGVGPLERVERKMAAELCRLFQNADGSMNSNTVQTALLLPALVAMGLPKDEGPVAKGIEWLLSRRVDTIDGGMWFDVFASDVWTTAFTMRALLRSGSEPGDERITAAVRWLLSRQLTVDQPWPNQRRDDVVKRGGWPFQTGNETMADADDAGVVLSAFGLALEVREGVTPLPEALAREVRASMDRARVWLRAMQNPDGGWSAFVWGLPERPDGPIMTKPIDVPPDSVIKAIEVMIHPPPDLGDPSTEDLTGRVLHGLAACGARTTDDEVVKAVAFLRRHQCDHGGWWGRWVCNYLASSSYVLSALDALGEDASQTMVQKGTAFLLDHQNADGGWGESIHSYTKPELAGRGPSTAPLTSLVVCALVDLGLGDRDETKRGVTYLLAKQRPDGTWPNDDYVATNIPPDGFYVYDGAARHMPLEALGRWARRHEPEILRPGEHWGRWTSAVLDPARERMDPLADAVVDRVHHEGEVKAVNALLRSIFENDDPIPANLPPLAAKYFEDTEALPDWADPARIVRAQKLFADHGVQITFGLFCSSLPQSYAAAKGAEVLTRTGGMTRRVHQRIFETAQFLFDVLDVGGLDAKGRGIRSAQRVRLMHAGVRHLLLHAQAHGPGLVGGAAAHAQAMVPWDHAHFGAPINQEDMAGTLMTFSVVTFDAMRKLGVEATEAEGDDWIHLWAVVGHFLGVERGLVPDGIEDARDLMDAIRERQWAPSPAGKSLTAALVEMMQRFFTRGHFRGFTPTMLRYLSGNHCADVLDVAPANWTLPIVTLGAGLAELFDRDERETLLEKLFGKLAYEVMEGIIALERDGKRASFRIPASLKKTVVPNT